MTQTQLSQLSHRAERAGYVLLTLAVGFVAAVGVSVL
jgi:hypothetical protein